MSPARHLPLSQSFRHTKVINRCGAGARERDSDGRARILDGQLSNRQLDDLHDMLRGLKVERKSIEEGMMFCLDHSEAADEVIDALVESLTLSAAESHVEKKMARLYLLSDILHNASAPYPKTARFRSQIESKLPGGTRQLPGGDPEHGENLC